MEHIVLELPVRVAFGQFATFFKTYREDSGEVNFLLKSHRVSNDIVVFSDTISVPSLDLAAFRRLQKWLLRFRIIINLLYGQKSRHLSIVGGVMFRPRAVSQVVLGFWISPGDRLRKNSRNHFSVQLPEVPSLARFDTSVDYFPIHY